MMISDTRPFEPFGTGYARMSIIIKLVNTELIQTSKKSKKLRPIKNCYSSIFFFKIGGVTETLFVFSPDIFPDISDFWSFFSSFQAKSNKKGSYTSTGILDTMFMAMGNKNIVLALYRAQGL